MEYMVLVGILLFTQLVQVFIQVPYLILGQIGVAVNSQYLLIDLLNDDFPPALCLCQRLQLG